MRSRQLVRQAYLGQPDTFLTLTVNPDIFKDPADRARHLARAWRLLRLRVMRKYKWKSLPFICVFEKTKRGEPHLHILLRSTWISQKFISETMEELMGAPIVDIRRIDDHNKLAAYIAKYIGKDPTMFAGTKRYWSSRDYALPDPRLETEQDLGPFSFNVIKCTAEEYRAQVKGNGFVSDVLGDRKYSLVWDPHYWTR